MRTLIKQWAEAGDPNAMIKLAELNLEEGNAAEAKKLLSQATAKNYRPAAIKLARIFHKEGDLPQAIHFYEIATEQGDVEAMDTLVKICADDEKILDFVLENIDKHYNNIYSTDSMERMMTFGSMRIEEYTPGYAAAVERRRIRNKILKLKAKGAR